MTSFVQPFGSTDARSTARNSHRTRAAHGRRLVDRILAELNRAA